MIKTALTAASLALVATATPAIAGDANSAKVSFADLDLSTAEGQETLDNRINRAARSVCQIDGGRTGTHINSRKCYNDAQSSVKEQVAAVVLDAQRGG